MPKKQTAQDKIAEQDQNLRRILAEFPEVRYEIEAAYRRGCEQIAFSLCHAIREGMSVNAQDKYLKDLHSWRYNQRFDFEGIKRSNWRCPPDPQHAAGQQNARHRNRAQSTAADLDGLGVFTDLSGVMVSHNSGAQPLESFPDEMIGQIMIKCYANPKRAEEAAQAEIKRRRSALKLIDTREGGEK